LAIVHEQQGNARAALSFAEESLSIAEHLVSLDPSNAMWRKDLGASRAQAARLRKAIENS
jgi:hypothetical protein